mgnify:CR=1 FL=1
MSDANGGGTVIFASGLLVGAAWVEESVTATEPLVKSAALVGMVGLLAYAYVEGQR